MKTKIKSLTVVNLQGTRAYCVGEVYNELLLDRIEDKSIEYEDSITIIYIGFTEEDDIVFEVINAPIDVEYDKPIKGEIPGPPDYARPKNYHPVA